MEKAATSDDIHRPHFRAKNFFRVVSDPVQQFKEHGKIMRREIPDFRETINFYSSVVDSLDPYESLNLENAFEREIQLYPNDYFMCYVPIDYIPTVHLLPSMKGIELNSYSLAHADFWVLTYVMFSIYNEIVNKTY